MIVSLYIKVQEQYDQSLELVVDRFKERVEDDGGTFEAGTCLQNTILSLGGVYGVGLNTITDFSQRVLADSGTFESGNCLLQTINSLGGVAPAVAYRNVVKRIELFEDEKISITSSIQNINDISKVFTDYTQSFTIPASDNNNEIFRHWYENSLDNGFDQRLRYDGYIEIDTNTFRKGRWQIEGASVKNNRIENYKITFYGELKSLTDKFGEDKLKDVETLNDYTFTYSGTTVKNKIQSTTDEDVMFPLITSDRVWQSTGVTNTNIFSSTGAILYTDLFPAVKISKVIEAIENKYNLNFSGSFLTDERFTKSYIWFKNNEAKTFNFVSIPNIITLTNNFNGWFNISNNTIDIVKFFDGAAGIYNAQFNINITFSASTNSVLKVYKNGVLFTSITNTGTSSSFIINQTMGIGLYYFEIQTSSSVSYTYSYNAKRYVYTSSGGATETTFISASGSNSSLPNIDLTNNAPDIKVSDFFSGVLKMFNLTTYSNDGINFTIEQLENWYYLGEIKDYSEYCTTDLDFERIKPYKKINLNYQKSESLMNVGFSNLYNRQYGDLIYSFNTLEGSDYTITLPFENMLFQSTPLNVGYALKSDFTPYKVKPTVMYYTGSYSRAYYFNDGTTNATLSSVNLFTSDMQEASSGEINTLNWGIENSNLFPNAVSNTLFNNYYLAYLSNLYSLKSRMVKVKMRLPYTELLNLKLNDRIVIRDKRYIINQYTTDLTTFESDFELIQDFRSVNFNNSTLRQTDNTSKLIDIPTTSATPLTWSIESDIDSMLTGISFNEVGIKIDVKQNTSGLQRSAGIISNLNDRIIIIQDA